MPQNYSQSGTLWVYGDSVGLRLFNSVKDRPLCKSLYNKCGNSYMWVYPFQNKGLDKLEKNLDFRPGKVIETVVNALRTPEMQQEESALLLNLVLHFVRSVNFTTYQRLIDDLILVLKAKELSQGKLVPNHKAKIIWKSSTAICKEKASSSKETDFRFYTTQVCTLWFFNSIWCENMHESRSNFTVSRGETLSHLFYLSDNQITSPIPIPIPHLYYFVPQWL